MCGFVKMCHYGKGEKARRHHILGWGHNSKGNRSCLRYINAIQRLHLILPGCEPFFDNDTVNSAQNGARKAELVKKAVVKE